MGDPTNHNERVLLVGIALPGIPTWEAEDSLEELSRLVSTANLYEIGRVIQSRTRIDSAYYLGSGKIDEIKSQANRNKADMLVFDNELSPAQMRNIEQRTDMRILDRSAVILDIFSRHARTRTAQVQVELAQLNYLLPRLTRMWTHLSRQAGGGAIRGMGSAGVRGPGETQLETDRRMIHRQIKNLTGKLDRISTQMSTSRKRRSESFRIALVGYTNAGKSTLMRTLSESNVLVEDRLFATLDSTTRLIQLGPKTTALLTDTVGFIKRLPHHLFASFRATLEEAVEADLILHVVDFSYPNYKSHINTVESVLRDLQLEDRATLTLFNKVDQMNQGPVQSIVESYNDRDDSLVISAKQNFGIEDLRKRIASYINNDLISLSLKIPQSEGRLLSQLYKQAEIVEEIYESNNVLLKIRIKNIFEKKLKLERFANI